MLTKYGLPVLAALALVFAVVSVKRMAPHEAAASPPLPPPATP